MKQPTNLPSSESINQRTNRSMNQLTNQLANTLSTNESILQQPTNQSNNESTNQWINQSTNKSNNQSTSQPTNQPTNKTKLTPWQETNEIITLSPQQITTPRAHPPLLHWVTVGYGQATSARLSEKVAELIALVPLVFFFSPQEKTHTHIHAWYDAAGARWTDRSVHH